MPKTDRSLRILQVSTFDVSGGAEKVARNLFQAYRERGAESWLAVGHKTSEDQDVFPIPNDQNRSAWSRFWMSRYSDSASTLNQENRGAMFRRFFPILAEPGKAIDYQRGMEDFRFPGTWELLNLPPQPPNILHCHNLHGAYFDLRALPWLSRQLPLILTLHDAWLLSGHCAHSLGCERWKIGCGQCPDLRLEPAVLRDATADNWRRKRTIYGESRIYVSTPSQWLMDKVKQSMLAAAVIEEQVIPNGVDLRIFYPANKQAVRSALHLPQDAVILLFTANNVRQNMWKDYRTVRAAMSLVAEALQEQPVIFIAMGEDAPGEQIGQAELRFIPYETDSAKLVRYYQAADVYIHAAKADTFPNTILEALACGTPVIATAVGGIPEQIEDGQTGYLIPPGDVQAFASRILEYLSDPIHSKHMHIRAAESARRRFDLQLQADAYLAWYQAILRQEENVLVVGKA